FLSYTDKLNKKDIPNKKSYLINYYENLTFNGYYKVAGLRRMIAKIKKENLADVIVVSMHFGSEYQMEPSSRQINLVNDIANAGANVIIGHHPHVLQPMDFYTTSKGLDTFVAYSL